MQYTELHPRETPQIFSAKVELQTAVQIQAYLLMQPFIAIFHPIYNYYQLW
jgi:hypothetical protein